MLGGRLICGENKHGLVFFGACGGHVGSAKVHRGKPMVANGFEPFLLQKRTQTSKECTTLKQGISVESRFAREQPDPARRRFSPCWP